jgi:hypothetical protein
LPRRSVCRAQSLAVSTADIAAKKITNDATTRGLTGVLAEVSAEATVTLDAPPEPVVPPGFLGLAFTGSNILGYGAIAALLLSVGLFFFFLAMRRKRQQEQGA